MSEGPSAMAPPDTAGGSATFDLTQFYQVFFEEAGENLANMEAHLLALDCEQVDAERMNAIFRCAHSIKGGAATFGFADVAELTHSMETLLDRLRRGDIRLELPMVDALLNCGDALRGLLARHQGTTKVVIDQSELIARIRSLTGGRSVPAPVPQQTVQTVLGAVELDQQVLEITLGPLAAGESADSIAELFREIPDLGTIEAIAAGPSDASGRQCFKVVTSSSEAELIDLFCFHVARDKISIRALAGEEPSAASRVPVAAGTAAGFPAAPGPLATGNPQAGGFGFFGDSDAAAPGKPAPAQAGPQAPAAHGGVAVRSGPSVRSESATLRVSVEKVDQLINLVGELVITQAMLAQAGSGPTALSHEQLMTCLGDLERHTRQLQESVMAIRMIPMATVFSRFPRLLRDMAGKLGKRVELVTIGDATELDKGMIEKITDPLTHLVRNSLDHGIEAPEVRLAAGKPAIGTITLTAEHRGGVVVIEVRDDGRGLSRDKILAKAREQSIPAPDTMTDQEAWLLVFEPGFSTAEHVTEVSGRGVGMDVVRRNILALGGSVELDSAEGYGTRVSVKLPLTLAIMDGMSVAVARETYIVPLASVIESIQLDQQQIRSIAGANRVIRVREEYLPVVSLEEVFGVPRFDPHGAAGILVIVEFEGTRVALLVDELVGQQQVVVKNLEANYRKVPGISGATIMADGRVALILDVAHLVKRSRH